MSVANNHRARPARGFTRWELLVVLAVLGALAAITMWRVLLLSEARSQEAIRATEVERLESEAEAREAEQFGRFIEEQQAREAADAPPATKSERSQ